MKKRFVYNTTISKNVPGALSNPGESKLLKVGSHKVLLSRKERLDKYGNPVHMASVISKNGVSSKPYKSNGGGRHAVAGALRTANISVKYRNR